MKLTTERLEAIAAKMREQPPIENKNQSHSRQESVKLLTKEIRLMQKRGYNLDQIAEMLRGEGLDIATPTLRNYLQRSKPPKKVTPKPPKDTPPSEAPITQLNPTPQKSYSPSVDTADL